LARVLFITLRICFLSGSLSHFCVGLERACVALGAISQIHFDMTGCWKKWIFPLHIVILAGAEFQITLNLHLRCAHRRLEPVPDRQRLVLNNSLSRSGPAEAINLRPGNAEIYTHGIILLTYCRAAGDKFCLPLAVACIPLNRLRECQVSEAAFGFNGS
jgi:hypothetical protein